MFNTRNVSVMRNTRRGVEPCQTSVMEQFLLESFIMSVCQGPKYTPLIRTLFL